MKKMFRPLFLFALLTSSLLFQHRTFAQVVYDNNEDEDNIVVRLKTGTGSYSFGLFQERSTSTTTNRTHTVYLPLAGKTSSIDNRDFSYYKDRTNLPQITSGTSPDGENYLEFNLYLDVLGSDTYLNVGISTESSPTSFEVIGSIDYPSYGDGARTIAVDLKDICDYDTDVFDCSKFEFSDNPSDDEEISLFFFLEDGNVSNGTAVNKEDYSGVIYRLRMSNRVYTTIPRLNELTKGDSQLVATVDGFEMDNDFDSWFVRTDSSTCTDSATNQTLLSLGIDSSSLRDLENRTIDGIVRINELTNGTCYSIRLFQCDKYGFCSYSTEQVSGTPEEIQALLEKQSCFFFTAGFGGEHYVVTFFQKWRDEVLSQSWWGQQFIDWYYRSAPQITPYILDKPWLQNVIKIIGYVLYGLIRYAELIMSLAVVVFLIGLTIVQSRKFKY